MVTILANKTNNAASIELPDGHCSRQQAFLTAKQYVHMDSEEETRKKNGKNARVGNNDEC
jgi:hypothetical protein